MTAGSYLPVRGYDRSHPMYYFSECFVCWMGRTIMVPFRTLTGKKFRSTAPAAIRGQSSISLRARQTRRSPR